MEAKVVDYHVRLHNVKELNDFSQYVKDAIVERISHVERFSAIRLAGTSIAYSDWLHSSRYGVAHHATDSIEIGNNDSALQVAGTVIHELAHMLVGHGHAHNHHWTEAHRALGLLNEHETYTIEDFTPDALEITRQAIERFAKDHPALVYDIPDTIPVPPHIGFVDENNFCTISGMPAEACELHKKHVLDFQVKGVHWMIENSHNILLADEMGLGKTWTTMLYINIAKPKKILIGCPNNAKLIWLQHFQELAVEKYNIEVAHTNLYMFTTEVVIMNYEAIVKWGLALAKVDWDLVVWDEGHYLKNPSARRSKAAYSIHGKKEIVITGTPIVNYPFEIFPLLHYLDRRNWPEFKRFEARYGSRGKFKFGYNLNQLNSFLRSTVMLRRLKKDVLKQLPRKRRQIVEFEVPDHVRPLIEEENKLYDALQNDAVGMSSEQVALLNALKNEGEVAINDIDWGRLIDELQYTRRYAFEEMARISHAIGLAKLPLIYEHIENALESKEKVIVFGHHRDVLTAIAKHFANENPVLLMGGNVDQPGAILAAQTKFNEDESCHLFVGGIKIAQSFSLTGSSTVIFVEEMWIPGDHTQAEDRAHGIGRGDRDAKSMLIQHLVWQNSLDTKKAKMTIAKQRSIRDAVGSET